MSILVKGTDFGPTEQVTSTKLDNLVDAASFTNTSEAAVSYSGSTGTCLQGGGLEVTSAGQLQIKDSDVDLVKFSAALKDSIHPVGIILETTQESTAAAFQTKIGFGTWEAYGEGRVLVGFGSTTDDRSDTVNFSSVGDEAGEFQHVLTAGESGVKNHTHSFRLTGDSTPDSGSNGGFVTGNSGFTASGTTGTATDTSGEQIGGTTEVSGSAHNNMQPYIVVYRYRRTA